MTIDMSQFYQVFFDEADELLAEMEKLLLAIDVAAPESEELNAIFRAAHSIKGGAATFGFSDITEVTHVLESLLDRIRKGEMALTAEHVDAFLLSKDVLDMLMASHRNGSQVDRAAIESVSLRLNALSRGQSPAPAESPVATVKPTGEARPVADADGNFHYRIELPPVPEKDVDALAGELALLGTLTQDKTPEARAVLTLISSEPEETLAAICAFVLDPDTLKISDARAPAPAAVQPVDVKADSEEAAFGLFVQPVAVPPTVPVSVQAPAAAEPAAAPQDSKPAVRRSADKEPAGAESSSIRVSVEKVDQLINLVGELVITQAMIEQRMEALDPILHERLLNSAGQLARNTRDLQEAVMSIRMMPMDYVFSRFPRMVRDLAGKLGKKVEFLTKGAATELDKGLIERIVDPLTHLVRNSIDHGVEMPAKRRASGKSETGKLTLSAAHQGGNVVIEVSDDGAGLDRARILAKARQNGLPVSDSMSDNDVWQLIFAPGFSTAEVVTDVSGRGVGMDVVKRNIHALGGRVEIESAIGQGTRITIRLPLTLAILDGLSVTVGEELFIVPLSYIVESLQTRVEDVKSISNHGQVIQVRGEYLPVVKLHELFNIPPRVTDMDKGIMVILESDGMKKALFVDDLVSQHQVVIKSLETNYRKVEGISGATIMGDGKVALIIDAGAIVRSEPPMHLAAA
jgi:two-component system chemotaxis sensor kinase CheA